MQNIITTIDLGSNSFRVLKLNSQDFTVLGEYEKPVGTADGLAKTKNISKEALQRIITAINESKELLDYETNKAVAVTTQAMRVAKNNYEILKTIKEKTGVEFKIIDGNKEAELTLLAIEYALKRQNIPNDKFILLDIGGGSTEIIIYDNENKKIKSFAYGIVTLSQNKNKDELLTVFEKEISSFIENLSLEDFLFVSTAGTPTTIAALKHNLDYESYDKNIINGTKLYISDLNEQQTNLNNLEKDELIKKVGSGREEFIDMGVEIFKLFYKVLDKNYSLVFDDGLREGVAIDYIINNS